MVDELKKVFRGDIENSTTTLDRYSHDASLFEIKPELVAFPKDTKDLEALVKFVVAQKSYQPNLSLTARSGGTDMSGGAINDSIIVAFDRYFNSVGPIVEQTISAQPGVYYRDFEKLTLKQNLLMPSYPASREICMIGGMVANNSGGEKSLVYGKTQNYVTELKIILSDGEEHTFRPLHKSQLDIKLQEQSLEGDLYRLVYKLVTENDHALRVAKPKVSKNSSGYNLWDVWDGETFDMTKLIVGSQGTLGLITEATFKLVSAKPLSGMVVILLPTLKNLGDIINALLPLQPTSLESFDEHTLKFAFRFFFTFRKTLGWKKFIFLALSFIPVLNKLLRFLPHFPKMIILAEFEGDNQAEIDKKISAVQTNMKKYDVETQIAEDKSHEEKFWVMRRESFNLLRKNVKRKHTAPFIDDLIVPPHTLPQFLPQLIEIMERYKLLYTIAGHVGDGNFHIIPLMDLTDKSEREKIPKVLDETIALILKYNGSLSGEHNDGLIRGPFLAKMYPPPIISLFDQVKTAFDPLNIFNPHKKSTADWSYAEQHIRRSF